MLLETAMNTAFRLLSIVLLAGGGELAAAERRSQLPVYRKPSLETGIMGGVANPSKKQLLAMHKSQYILHARDGVLARVPVEKTWLPGDPGDMSHQELMGRLVLADDGTVYVMGRSIVCKSTDGGKTWISYPHDGNRDRLAGKWGAYPDQVPLFIQVLRDGTLVGVGIPHAQRGEQYWTSPAIVWASDNGGHHWHKISQIERPLRFAGVDYEWWYASYAMHRLPDDTLLWPVQLRNTVNTDPPYKKRLVIFRSADGGKTWQGPFPFTDWCSEGGITRTASGRLLATVRYQRPLLSTDPPDLLTHLGTKKGQAYKHVFLVESNDEGRTWNHFRCLMSIPGQCYGFPVGLADGRVVVVHTTPYGPGPRGSRAMISHDEGRTWEDEAYYLTFSEPSGYNQSVVLKDGTILTLASRHDFIAPWGTKTETAVAIRWKPRGRVGDRRK